MTTPPTLKPPTPDQRMNDRETIIKMASLVTQSALPKGCMELGQLLWRAFELGKEYRDNGGKE